MKDIFLLRHAKSDWSDSTLNDFDRPLNNRGLRNAPFMGSLFLQKHGLPDYVVLSPAKRVQETYRLFAETWPYTGEVINNQYIYDWHYESKKLLNLLEDLPEPYSRILLIGHNPGISQLITLLTGECNIHMPTCAWAHIKLEISAWKHITSGCGELLDFEYPKKHVH